MAICVGNRLIESLPVEYRSRLYSRLEPVSLRAGAHLYEPEETPEYAHFLTSGMASFVAYMEDGMGSEVGIIGCEGLVEAFHLLAPANVQTVQTRGSMQVEGTALRIRFADLRKEFLSCEALRDPILQFVQCQSSLLGQLGACNRLHEIEPRLARWLLMVQDRIGGDMVPLTQELLAQMLGTRRSSVTVAASALQRDGLIEYHRGQLHILRREQLQMVACECYPIARRLLAGLYTRAGSTRETAGSHP
jgi:CRP-like cAMP-binding protein